MGSWLNANHPRYVSMRTHKAVDQIRARVIVRTKIFGVFVGSIGLIGAAAGVNALISLHALYYQLIFMVVGCAFLTILAIFAVLHEDKR